MIDWFFLFVDLESGFFVLLLCVFSVVVKADDGVSIECDYQPHQTSLDYNKTFKKQRFRNRPNNNKNDGAKHSNDGNKFNNNSNNNNNNNKKNNSKTTSTKPKVDDDGFVTATGKRGGGAKLAANRLIARAIVCLLVGVSK
jgi:hypothetical protein